MHSEAGEGAKPRRASVVWGPLHFQVLRTWKGALRKSFDQKPKNGCEANWHKRIFAEKKSGTDSLTERISVALGARVAGAARACTSSWIFSVKLRFDDVWCLITFWRDVRGLCLWWKHFLVISGETAGRRLQEPVMGSGFLSICLAFDMRTLAS